MRDLGKHIRQAIDKAIEQVPEVKKVVADLRRIPAQRAYREKRRDAVLEKATTLARSEIVRALNLPMDVLVSHGYQHRLVEALTTMCGDPDIGVANWMSGPTPLEINTPPTGATAAQQESMRYYDEIKAHGFRKFGENYTSFKDNVKIATDEI